MIVDVSGVILTPGNYGENCMGNGEHFDDEGNLIECCCDECAYLMCCAYESKCENCEDNKCPRAIRE